MKKSTALLLFFDRHGAALFCQIIEIAGSLNNHLVNLPSFALKNEIGNLHQTIMFILISPHNLIQSGDLKLSHSNSYQFFLFSM